jgi:glutathione S-transferase
MSLKLYHCRNTRSLRPLWTLEEMGFAYELETMPFPPRQLRKDYLRINPLGTVFDRRRSDHDGVRRHVPIPG